ncbi:hypothetical protein ACHAXR_013563 [Thalassiosira sp. AJA248-18]
MPPYNISPNPAGGGENNSVSSRTQLPPSTVVLLDHLNRRREATIGSSEGTGLTCIETSPLSTEQHPSDTEHHRDNQKTIHRMYNGSHNSSEKATIKTKNYKKRVSHQHNSSSRPNSVRNHALAMHSETLTWQMDPTISLSDFTLIVIGIDDKNAIEKYVCAKKKKKRQSKRRDKWMVDGLYLDMSQSEDQSDEDCRDMDDIKEHMLWEHRSDIHVNSTLSGTKTSNYPVVEMYHLHRVQLAVGSRSCDYFARLFQKKDTSEDKKHSIEVPISCLSAIPVMLDYIYNPDPTATVHATTATAIPLRYLATLLGNRPLFEDATHFLHVDLRPETAVDYLQQAELYQQKKLAKVCIRICAERFDELKITWFASLAPHLMKKILHSRHLTRAIDSMTLCSKIASYIRCQMHKIDRKMMLTLTTEKVMPLVCPEEALFFIQMMIRLGMDMEDPNHDRHISSKENSLYERCIYAVPNVVTGVIDSLTQGNMGDMSPDGYRRKASRQTKNACGDYSRLPAEIKVDLLEYALAKQQKTSVEADAYYYNR